MIKGCDNMYCPKCGKKQEENAEYCKDCGVSIKSGYTNEDKKEIRIDAVKQVLRFIICFAYGFSFNIMGLLLYAYLRRKDSELANGVLIGTLSSIALCGLFIAVKLLK